MSRVKPSLSFDRSSGATLSWPGGLVAGEGVAAIRFRVDEDACDLCLTQPDTAVTDHDLRATWYWQMEESGSCRVWVVLQNEGSRPLHLIAVDVLAGASLDLGTPLAGWSAYQNGWASWTPAFARHLSESLYTSPGTPAYRAMHQPHEDSDGDMISSEWVTVVTNVKDSESPWALLVGFVTAGDQLGEMLLDRDTGNLTARCHFDGAVLAPGCTVRSEMLVLRAGPEPLALLEAWAEEAGREMEARVPDTMPTGWCTWYYFFGENTGDDVLANVEGIARHDLDLEVILLDDGYQTAIGDWHSIDNAKFPRGIEPVAEVVREKGHRLGIWTAPFGAAADSQLYADHADWFLCDEDGEPVVGWVHWGVPCYALDCTHPDVLAWLQETFERMRSAWGADFFKIDFLFAAAHAGRRYDPTATRAQALRRGVEAIRVAIGGDAFLLGCGAPLGPCVGLVDGMRVGPDVDPNWHPIWRHDLSMPSTENGLRNAITRAPFHGRLWANDPDCLLVRQRGPDLDLVLNEMRTLAALVGLAGGLTLNSDHLTAARPGRLKYLRQALPATGVSARPLDLFHNEMPQVLCLPVERTWGRWWVVGVTNWSDRTIETTVRLSDLGLAAGRYHVYHYWRRRYLGVVDQAVVVQRHQPHETAVLLFKPVSGKPDLLTTTFHVCQGVAEIADVVGYDVAASDSVDGGATFTLQVILEKAGRQFGEVLFSVPEGWVAVEGRVDGAKRPLVDVASGIVGLGLTLEGRAEVEVRFEGRLG